MSLMSVVALILAIGLGLGLTTLVWPRPGAVADQYGWALLGVRLAVASAVGIGAAGTGTFLWFVTVGPPGPGYRAVDTLVCLGLLTVAFARWRRDRTGPSRSSANLSSVIHDHAFVLGVVAILAGIHFAVLSAGRPYGTADAWTIWNLRALFLLRGGAEWRNAFAPEVVHAAYPLLLPGTVTRGWLYTAGESTSVPTLVALLFTMGAAGLLGSAVAALRGRAHGCLAALVLLGTPFFIAHGASQTADVPLAFYLLAVFVLLALHDRPGAAGTGGWLVLAGFLAGCAAWTKNEGLVHAAILVATRVAIVTVRRGRAAGTREALLLGSGLLPMLAVLAYFKLTLAPPTDLAGNFAWARAWDYISDPWRYVAVLRGAWWLATHAPDRFLPLLLPVVGLYAWLAGTASDARDRDIILQLVLALPLMVAAFFGAYLVTFWPVESHVIQSFDRLLLQVWPAFLFFVFLVVRPREQIA